MTTPERRSRFRRPPAVHRPAVPAPETAEEVLERAPDVSRETWSPLEPAPPPLRRDQIAKLEALTAVWAREVRVAGSPDDTLLYASSALPPIPPRRPRLEAVVEAAPPVPDPGVTLERSRQLLEQEAAEEALEVRRPPAPAPTLDPGRDGEPGPARRVSDWTSRHDPRSLEYPVRARLARAVPLQDVSLDAGPILDQGTTPPLSVRDASACVGMACAAAANALEVKFHPRAYNFTEEGLLREDDARRLYHRAQELDHVHGHDYAGTSVLAGLKAGQEAGWWDGYLWALGGTKDVAQVLLQLRVGVVVGVPWSADLEDPDGWGVIRPGGDDRGGHSLLVVGLKRGPLGGRPGPWFELQQSRGRTEGVGGRVYLHHTQLARLLGGIGEAGVPLPAELLD